MLYGDCRAPFNIRPLTHDIAHLQCRRRRRKLLRNSRWHRCESPHDSQWFASCLIEVQTPTSKSTTYPRCSSPSPSSPTSSQRPTRVSSSNPPNSTARPSPPPDSPPSTRSTRTSGPTRRTRAPSSPRSSSCALSSGARSTTSPAFRAPSMTGRGSTPRTRVSSRRINTSRLKRRTGRRARSGSRS